VRQVKPSSHLVPRGNGGFFSLGTTPRSFVCLSDFPHFIEAHTKPHPCQLGKRINDPPSSGKYQEGPKKRSFFPFPRHLIRLVKTRRASRSSGIATRAPVVFSTVTTADTGPPLFSRATRCLCFVVLHQASVSHLRPKMTIPIWSAFDVDRPFFSLSSHSSIRLFWWSGHRKLNDCRVWLILPTPLFFGLICVNLLSIPKSKRPLHHSLPLKNGRKCLFPPPFLAFMCATWSFFPFPPPFFYLTFQRFGKKKSMSFPLTGFLEPPPLLFPR